MNSPERYYFGGDRTKPVKKSDPPIFFQVSYLSHSAEVIKKLHLIINYGYQDRLSWKEEIYA